MNNYAGLFHRAAGLAALIVLADLGGCAPRTPEITREFIGLDASGRPVISYVTCEHYGLAGNLGGCTRETPPVVWCYQSLGANDCYRTPDRMATREPEPVVDNPTIPTLYELPNSRQPEPPPADLPDLSNPLDPTDEPIPAPPGKVEAAPPSAAPPASKS
jgi:hypothetical protein